MDAITTKNLTKKYKNYTAVDSVNLSIEQGSLFALLGVNGAGKTTIIKMLSCLIKPTSGDAILLGDSINDNPLKIKQKINISPQETAIALNLTVKENLEFISDIYYPEKEASRQAVEKIITDFNLQSILDKKGKTLSGGWQRRLSIAMALISNPQIVFLDEPTLGLDVIARRELWNIIKNLKKRITIILTTHYLEEVEALSDKVGIMSQGKLVAIGTVNELIAQTKTNNFEDAFISCASEKEVIK